MAIEKETEELFIEIIDEIAPLTGFCSEQLKRDAARSILTKIVKLSEGEEEEIDEMVEFIKTI